MINSMLSTTIAAAAAPSSGTASFIVNTLPLVAIFVIFYFLLIRPQQRRMREHQAGQRLGPARMLDFPRWKVWSITLVILAGILFAIPSMLPADLKARYPSFLPNATINLGLDLAGGSQLLLEADQADAAKQRLQAMED